MAMGGINKQLAKLNLNPEQTGDGDKDKKTATNRDSRTVRVSMENAHPQSTQAPPAYEAPPPPYTPVATMPVTAIAPEHPIQTLDYCLSELKSAYGVDFPELAKILGGFPDYSIAADPFLYMIDPFRNSVEKTDRKLYDLYMSANKTSQGDRSLLSKLVVIFTMLSMEQQGKTPRKVAENFFSRLLDELSKTKRNDMLQKIKPLVRTQKENLATIEDCNLKFSGLRFENIPGSTVKHELLTKLNEYKARYKFDFPALVEAIADTSSKNAYVPDPLISIIDSLNIDSQSKKSFFADKNSSFREKNAKFVVLTMESLQKKVFSLESSNQGTVQTINPESRVLKEFACLLHENFKKVSLYFNRIKPFFSDK
ncbi:hypothetical protein [Endozoicomonas sp.]|uniref:hypothetical protein n=1 Tax=Endozoicomonas sp. TaxID=1892382 RepID=UPI00383B9A9F